MDSGILNKRGVSLLEVTAVVLIIGVLLTMVISSYSGRINQANYEKTVNELSSIAQATIDFYNSEGSWPSGISQLAPLFMPHAVTSSPFGTSYNIVTPASGNNMVTVNVLIPAGIAQSNPQGTLLKVTNQGSQDNIQISQTFQNEFSSRLNYCLKNIC